MITFLINFNSCNIFIKYLLESCNNNIIANFLIVCLIANFALNKSIIIIELKNIILICTKIYCRIVNLKVSIQNI